MANEVKIPILVDIANSVNDLKKLQKAGNDSAKGLADAFSTVGKVASLAVAAFAGSKIIGFLSDAAQESAKAEAELNKLSTALRLAGNGGAEALAGLEAFSEAIQANTTFENDAVIANLAYLQSLTNLNVNGLKVAQQAAVDLSAALGIDLQTATQLVGKAANGEVGAFKRYGIEIAKGATDAETFSNALAKLAQFQGSAAAQTNTFDGALRQNNNAFNDVLKAIGP